MRLSVFAVKAGALGHTSSCGQGGEGHCWLATREAGRSHRIGHWGSFQPEAYWQGSEDYGCKLRDVHELGAYCACHCTATGFGRRNPGAGLEPGSYPWGLWPRANASRKGASGAEEALVCSALDVGDSC